LEARKKQRMDEEIRRGVEEHTVCDEIVLVLERFDSFEFVS